MATIAAAVTIAPDNVSGDIPVIIARDEEEREKIAGHIANVLKGTVHDLGNGTYLIVEY